MARPRPVSEFAAIARLEALFRETSAGVELGIGDDAALLNAKGRLVWTVDTAVEHVHFERAWLSLADVGFRSFQAAASDVSAMGAVPWAALSSVIFPARFRDADLLALARGQRAAARELGCSIIGGNLARGSELSVTTTVLGRVRRPLLRSGARVGDELWLCGELGLAAAGLRLLQRGVRRGTGARAKALAAFRKPRAQHRLGPALVGRAHAAIDVSDGLAGDAAHLASASGVRIVIDLAALTGALSPALQALAGELGVGALKLALYGGEDYAIVAAGPRRGRPAGARVIGRIEAGRGVWLADGNDALRRAASGYVHSGGRKPTRVGT